MLGAPHACVRAQLSSVAVKVVAGRVGVSLKTVFSEANLARVRLPVITSAGAVCAWDGADHADVRDDVLVWIVKVVTPVRIFSSGNSQPKRFECFGSDGRSYTMVVKKDETRQDALMQQLFDVRAR